MKTLGGRNLMYNDPYDFEDGVTASEWQERQHCPYAVPQALCSSPNRKCCSPHAAAVRTKHYSQLPHDNHFSLYVCKT